MTATSDMIKLLQIYGYSIHDITGNRKDVKTIIQRRHIASILRGYGYSYPQIGDAMNRHHTAIMALVDKSHAEKRKKYYKKDK